MKTNYDFFAFCSGNLSRPDQSQVHKQGKGVFRRVFTFVPAAGEGAVNYKVPIFTGIKGSNSMHQFKDVGTPGVHQGNSRPGCAIAIVLGVSARHLMRPVITWSPC